jgi:hypothetical protein
MEKTDSKINRILLQPLWLSALVAELIRNSQVFTGGPGDTAYGAT